MPGSYPKGTRPGKPPARSDSPGATRGAGRLRSGLLAYGSKPSAPSACPAILPAALPKATASVVPRLFRNLQHPITRDYPDALQQYLNAPSGEELSKALRQALAVPYKVYRGGEFVAEGVSGGAEHELPAGEYEVRFRRDGKAQVKKVGVIAETRVQVTLP